MFFIPRDNTFLIRNLQGKSRTFRNLSGLVYSIMKILLGIWDLFLSSSTWPRISERIPIYLRHSYIIGVHRFEGSKLLFDVILSSTEDLNLINMKNYYVYILTNRSNKSLYIGVTNNLVKRIYQHQNSKVNSFCSKYNMRKLIYFEEYSSILEAIKREKQLKHWNRAWKIELIESMNPDWQELPVS